MRHDGNEHRGGWIGAAAALALMIFGLTGIIRWIAGDASGMRNAMLRFAPPPATGLPEQEYAGAAEMLTGYLTGRVPEFQYAWTDADGQMYLAFHDYEAEHMADCRALIRLDTAVCCTCLVLTAGLAAAAAVRARKRGPGSWLSFLRGGRTGFWILSGIAAAFVLWACVDFDSLFLCFHRAAFRTDLWLLNPGTDLLIRLMPEALFEHLGVKGLSLAAIWTGLTGAGIRLGIRRLERGGKHEIPGNHGRADQDAEK